jgi:hypothetical protein
MHDQMFFHARDTSFIHVDGSIAAASMLIHDAAQSDAQGTGDNTEISAIRPMTIPIDQQFLAHASTHDQPAELPFGKFVGGSTPGYRRA